MRHLQLLVSFMLLASIAAFAGAYVTQIHAPAVLQNENQGVLTVISLNLTGGNGSVKINGPLAVASSTVDSAQEAVSSAASYVGVNASDYDFTYEISGNGGNVSGPSGGLAFALLATSALQHRQLVQNFSSTGTIDPNGVVGVIGGVYDKAEAASQGGMRFLLVPSVPDSSFEDLLYYISQQHSNISLVEVGNLSQALPYALGIKAAAPLNINLYENYNVSQIPASNITCSSCNTGAFSELTNSTFGYTTGYIENISGSYGAAKQSLLQNIGEYKQLAGKGYLYTAADFAFLDFFKAFTLSHASNLSAADASQLISNVSSYCSSLLPPPLTDTNYEFVVGGELRQLWANSSINSSETILGSEQTTDDIAQSVYQSASALGWCQAANAQYSIASSLGGTYVTASPILKSEASALMSKAASFGTNMYLQSALKAYRSGDYVTALYAAEYANVFGSPDLTGNMTNSALVNATLANIGNATSGTWPSQFAAEAQYYLKQAAITHNSSAASGYLGQAYTISLLAKSLASADSELSSAFMVENASSVSATVESTQFNDYVSGELNILNSQINSIDAQLRFLRVMLIVLYVLLLGLLITTLVLLMKGRGAGVQKSVKPAAKPRRRGRKQ